jgi:hypothetical protein
MQTTEFAHPLGTGAQSEVVGIGEQHALAQFLGLLDGDALQPAEGAHRHETGRRHRTVQGTQDASAGMTISGKKSESEGHKAISEVGMMNDEQNRDERPDGVDHHAVRRDTPR